MFNRKLAAARRLGVGLHTKDWRLAASIEAAATLAQQVIDWCRETMSTSRRPYGVDSFDLAIALRFVEAGRVSNLRLTQLRAIELYGEELPGHLTSVFSRVLTAVPAQIHLSAGFFSWGDAVYRVLGPGAQAKA